MIRESHTSINLLIISRFGLLVINPFLDISKYEIFYWGKSWEIMSNSLVGNIYEF